MIPKNALAQGPDGYNLVENSWSEICEEYPYLSPLDGDFSPNDETAFQSFAVTPLGAVGPTEWFDLALPSELGSTYESESLDPLAQCYWNAYIDPALLPGGQSEAVTPEEVWTARHVSFAKLGFIYYMIAPIPLIAPRPWQFDVTWIKTHEPNQGTEVVQEISGEIEWTGDNSYGYILENTGIREGYTIKSVQLKFERAESTAGNFLPQAELFVDRIVFIGYEPEYIPTPTSTRTPTATSTPNGYTPTPTQTPRNLWDTPTPTPTGVTPQPTKPFPAKYSRIPTVIPPLIFPTWPAVAQITTPQPISLLIPTPPVRTPVPLFTLAPLDFSVVGTPASNPPTPTPWPWTEQIISYTTYLSDSANINPTETFTILNAPADYAPDLPRPFANIGYTFESMSSAAESGQQFSLHTWAALLGYSASLPVQFVKMLYQFVIIIGPVGLFIIWILIMLPFRLWVTMFIFIKNSIIASFNMVVKIIRFIGDVWDLIPGL